MRGNAGEGFHFARCCGCFDGKYAAISPLGPRGIGNFLLLHDPAAKTYRSGNGPEGEGGEARHQTHQRDDEGGNEHRTRRTGKLAGDIRTQIAIVIGIDARDDGARANGHEKCRNLSNKAIADSQKRIELKGVIYFTPLLQHPDCDATDQVDENNDDASDSIALHKLHGTIHGAIKLVLLVQNFAPRGGFGLRNVASTHFRINAHLATGHGVEVETSSNFGHALGTLGDHHELNRGDDEEHHKADDQIAFGDEIAKGFNNMARIPIGENEAGSGNGNGEPEGRAEQNDGGKS